MVTDLIFPLRGAKILFLKVSEQIRATFLLRNKGGIHKGGIHKNRTDYFFQKQYKSSYYTTKMFSAQLQRGSPTSASRCKGTKMHDFPPKLRFFVLAFMYVSLDSDRYYWRCGRGRDKKLYEYQKLKNQLKTINLIKQRGFSDLTWFQTVSY